MRPSTACSSNKVLLSVSPVRLDTRRDTMLAGSIHERAFRVLCTPSPCPSPPLGGEGIETAPSPSERERAGVRVAHEFTHEFTHDPG
jgi:hypothetical protein